MSFTDNHVIYFVPTAPLSLLLEKQILETRHAREEFLFVVINDRILFFVKILSSIFFFHRAKIKKMENFYNRKVNKSLKQKISKYC